MGTSSPATSSHSTGNSLGNNKTFKVSVPSVSSGSSSTDSSAISSNGSSSYRIIPIIKEKPSSSVTNGVTLQSSAHQNQQNGLTKSSDLSMDTTSTSSSIGGGGGSTRNGGESPDDYEKEERRRAQRVLGKQG